MQAQPLKITMTPVPLTKKSPRLRSEAKELKASFRFNSKISITEKQVTPGSSERTFVCYLEYQNEEVDRCVCEDRDEAEIWIAESLSDLGVARNDLSYIQEVLEADCRLKQLLKQKRNTTMSLNLTYE